MCFRVINHTILATSHFHVRDKRLNCGVILTDKTYRYRVYAEIFVTANCGAERDSCYHLKSYYNF